MIRKDGASTERTRGSPQAQGVLGAAGAPALLTCVHPHFFGSGRGERLANLRLGEGACVCRPTGVYRGVLSSAGRHTGEGVLRGGFPCVELPAT